MLALPVLFERSGKFTADFMLKDNGINDVLLNEESMMTIAPVSVFFGHVIVFNHEESLSLNAVYFCKLIVFWVSIVTWK